MPAGARRPQRLVERLVAWLEREPRPIARVRLWRTALRTAHLAAVGALYGGHVYGVDADRLLPALAGVLLSGGALVALEVRRAPIWLVQLRGLATGVKLLLLAAVPFTWPHRVALLTLALVIGSVSSHMPARWRYRSWIHGRVVGPTERG